MGESAPFIFGFGAVSFFIFCVHCIEDMDNSYMEFLYTI
jgi:hypothetical protein